MDDVDDDHDDDDDHDHDEDDNDNSEDDNDNNNFDDDDDDDDDDNDNDDDGGGGGGGGGGAGDWDKGGKSDKNERGFYDPNKPLAFNLFLDFTSESLLVFFIHISLLRVCMCMCICVCMSFFSTIFFLFASSLFLLFSLFLSTKDLYGFSMLSNLPLDRVKFLPPHSREFNQVKNEFLHNGGKCFKDSDNFGFWLEVSICKKSMALFIHSFIHSLINHLFIH